MKLLAVDDNPDNLVVYKAILKQYLPDLIVKTATSGEESLEVARDSQPDVILLDIQMPEMDGYKTCQILKSSPATKHIPVVFLTATNTDSQSKVKGLDAGADAFLVKPVQEAELIAQLNVLLRMKKMEDLLRQQRDQSESIARVRKNSLHSLESQYRAIMETLSELVVIVSSDFTVMEWNKAAESFSGRSRSDVLSRNLFEVLADDPELQEQYRSEFMKLVEGQDAVQTTRSFRTPTGASLELLWQISCIRDSEGNVECYTGIGQDITVNSSAERKQAEALRLASESARLASIGVIAGGITHEINQPLNVIRIGIDGVLVWAQNKPEALPHFVLESLRKVSGSANRLSDIVNHMRAFWSDTMGRSEEEFDLNDTISNALNLLVNQIRNHEIKLETRLADENLTIHGNAIQAEQIITNLVTNSIHALDEVTGPAKRIKVTTQKYQNEGIVTIEDNGPGFRDLDQEKLFDPFYSTKDTHKGMGLGLAIVKMYMDHLHGIIQVENQPEGGAVFTLRFRLNSSEKEAS